MANKTEDDPLDTSEEVCHAIIEAIPHVTWVGNLDGDVTFLNRAWAESLHPDDAPGQLAKWKQAYSEGAPYEGECRFVAKDGSYKHVSFVGVPVRDESGNITNWFGIDLDVTALKEAEELLRAKIRELEIANEAMVDRELRMVDLKDQNRRLKAQLSKHD